MPERPAPKSDNGEFFRQQLIGRKIVKRGQKFSFGKIAARAEYHHDARSAWNAPAVVRALLSFPSHARILLETIPPLFPRLQFYMPAKLVSHRAKKFFRKCMLLPRAIASEQRRRNHFAWHRLRHCRFNRPASFARIRHIT